MQTIIQYIVGSIIFLIVTFTFLFDPSEAALGLSIFPTMPTPFITMASIFGNMLWLLGVIYFMLSIILAVVVFYNDIFEKSIKKSIKDTIKSGETNITPNTIIGSGGNPLFPTFKWWTKILLGVGTLTSFLCIGSGFWFTGTGWLLFIIVTTLMYRKLGIEIAEDYIKEEMEKTA